MEDSSATGILSLPPELLHYILELISPNDILSTRQSCRHLAAVGAEHMLSEVVTVYRRDRFARLLEVAKHPVFPTKVESFYFQSERFEGAVMSHKEWNNRREDLRARSDKPYEAYEPDFAGYYVTQGWTSSQRSQRAFERSFKRWRLLRKGSYKPAELRDAYAKYIAMVEDHRTIEDEHFDLHCLTELFRSCRKLQNVSLSTGCGMKGWIDASSLAWRDVMVTPGSSQDDRNCGLHQFFTMITALREAKRDIKALSAMEMTYRILDPPPKVMSECLDVMKTLHELRIGLVCSNEELEADQLRGLDRFEVIQDADEELQDALDNGVLGRWLAFASELRVLKLSMCTASGNEPSAFIGDFMPDKTWTNLRELGLANVEAEEDDLVSLILRHKDTLERLSLSHIDLHTGDWDSVFRRIAGKLPKLRRVKLRHYFTEFGQEIFDFDVAGLETTRVHMLRDSIENLILNGGEIPDYDAIESHPNNWRYPWELENYRPPHKLGEDIYDQEPVEEGVVERVSAKFDDIL